MFSTTHPISMVNSSSKRLKPCKTVRNGRREARQTLEPVGLTYSARGYKVATVQKLLARHYSNVVDLCCIKILIIDNNFTAKRCKSAIAWVPSLVVRACTRLGR